MTDVYDSNDFHAETHLFISSSVLFDIDKKSTAESTSAASSEALLEFCGSLRPFSLAATSPCFPVPKTIFNMAEDWAFLERVHRILSEESILGPASDTRVVDFKYPDELLKIIDVSLGTQVPRTLDEAEEICRLILKYSVKTGHRFFCNQLFSGCDPYGIAGAWITDALNTKDSVIKKCLELFNFPDGDGIFSPGGSMSNMYAMVLARFKVNPQYKSTGMFGSPPLKIIDVSLGTQVPRTLDEAEEICRLILKYSVKTGHRFFCNQLFSGCDPYGIAGAWITDALNTSQYTFEVAPVFTLIEDSVIKKCLELFNFPDGDGIFSPGGSMSNMYAMVLARFKVNPQYKSTGMFGSPPLVAFTSQDAHYSLKKASHWMGIGLDNLVQVRTDNRGRMCPDALREAIERVKSEGRRPFFVNATAGTTVLGAFDDIHKLADVCEEAGIWLHLDACLGGTAILSERFKGLLRGTERVQSLAWNPHKTLGAPLQCSILLIQEKQLLHKCNCANADYLFQQDKFYDISYDTGDKSFQCGRKVDSFKFWLMLKVRGTKNLGERVDNALEMSSYLTEKLKHRQGFRLVLDEFEYTNICFWYIPQAMRGQEETPDWLHLKSRKRW
uniref:Glutamate decarboxylase n=1 Tax=Lutzomyia longipalpis TaxID=7200 RepID=A0A1B0CCF1_LUTLO